MGRRRVHDRDAILDAAEELFAAGGVRSVTVRALADRTGAPSGSLYHLFGSRSELLAHMWVRAARRFLGVQRAAIDAALGREGDTAIEATVVASTTIADMTDEWPNAAAVLRGQSRDALIGPALPGPLLAEIERLDGALLEQLRRLADALWQRTDRAAVETVAACVVDIAGALLLNPRPRIIDERAAVRAAVEGVLRQEPSR